MKLGTTLGRSVSSSFGHTAEEEKFPVAHVGKKKLYVSVS